jgi:hypothetical protein
VTFATSLARGSLITLGKRAKGKNPMGDEYTWEIKEKI